MLKKDEIKKLKDTIDTPSRDSGGGVVDVHLSVLEDLFEITENALGKKAEALAIIHALPLLESGHIAMIGINFAEFGPLKMFSGVSADFYGNKLQLNEIIESMIIPMNFKRLNKYNILANVRVVIYKTSPTETKIDYVSLMEDKNFLKNILRYPVVDDEPVMEWSFMDVSTPLVEFTIPQSEAGRGLVEKLKKYIIFN